MLKHIYVGEPSGSIIPADAVDLMDTSTFGTIKVIGLGRPDADLYSFAYAGVDASCVSGMSVSARTITLDVDTQNECQRMRLYRALPYKKARRFWFANDTGIYWIDGYVKELPYDEEGHEISSFEITVFCPYPWFRSVDLHEQEIIAGDENSASLAQTGDAPAGILVYAQGTLLEIGKILSFRLETRGGDYFEAESGARFHVHAPDIYRLLLVDTTPGGAGLDTSVMFSADVLASIDMSANLITVDPDDGVDISLTVSAASTSLRFFACWYDTFTAI